MIGPPETKVRLVLQEHLADGGRAGSFPYVSYVKVLLCWFWGAKKCIDAAARLFILIDERKRKELCVYTIC